MQQLSIDQQRRVSGGLDDKLVYADRQTAGPIPSAYNPTLVVDVSCQYFPPPRFSFPMVLDR